MHPKQKLGRKNILLQMIKLYIYITRTFSESYGQHNLDLSWVKKEYDQLPELQTPHPHKCKVPSHNYCDSMNLLYYRTIYPM